MIFKLMMIKSKILYRRFNEKFKKPKDKISLVIVMSFLFYLFVWGVLKLLSAFHVSQEGLIQINIIILLISLILIMSSVPLMIYRQFLENREIEILLIAPLKLRECFGFEIISVLTKICFIFYGILSAYIVAIKIRYHISIVSYIINSFVFLSFLCVMIYLLIFLLLRFLGSYNTKKLILFISGMTDIFFTAGIIYFTNYAEFNQIFERIKVTPIINNIYYCSVLMITTIKVFRLVADLLLLFVLLYIVYILFYQVYYISGFVGSDNKLKIKQKENVIGVKKYYFFEKDRKIIIRNFERLKSIIFTIIIFTMSMAITIINLKSKEFIFILLTTQFMAVFTTFQIAYDNIIYEKSKSDIFKLACLTQAQLWKQKNFYSMIVSFSICFIFDLFMLVIYHAALFEAAMIILISGFSILITSAWATFISMIILKDMDNFFRKAIYLMIIFIKYIAIYVSATIFLIVLIYKAIAFGFIYNVFILLDGTLTIALNNVIMRFEIGKIKKY